MTARFWARVCVALAACVAVSVWAAGVELNQEMRQLVERLVLERATTIATLQRKASAQEAAVLIRLDEREAALRREQSARRKVQTELAKVQRERSELIAKLEQQDRTFTAELASYRVHVSSIAASTDIRKVSALRAYADGDRQAAFDVLLEMQRAETRSVAAGWRELGALALDRYDRGETTASAVADVFREAQRLDPSDFEGWVQLARFERASGASDRALDAAQQAAKLAADAWQRALATSELAELHAERGDYPAALAASNTAIDSLRTLAAQTPNDRSVRRNLAAMLILAGEYHMARDARAAARACFEEAERIAIALRAERDTDVTALDHQASALSNLADLLLAENQIEAARQRFDALYEASAELARLEPGSRRRLRDLSVALDKRGLVRMDSAPAEAEASFNTALEIRRRLLAVDPAQVDALLDVAFSARRLSQARIARTEPEARTQAIALAEEAIQAAQQAQQLAPQRVDAALELALAHFQRGYGLVTVGRHSEAAEAFARAANEWDAVAAKSTLTAAHERLRTAARAFCSKAERGCSTR